jgi:hypothetical protein
MANEQSDSGQQQDQQGQQEQQGSTEQQHPSRDTETHIETFRRSSDGGKLKK